MKTAIRTIVYGILFGVFVIIGLELSEVIDDHRKHNAEMDLLKEQKITTLKEREKYDKQIEYLVQATENEKLRNEVYMKLR